MRAALRLAGLQQTVDRPQAVPPLLPATPEEIEVRHRATVARLLVVGGEAPIRSFIGAYLADAGFSICAAADARAALALARCEPPDLVLLDASVPGRDDPYVACRQFRTTVSSGLPTVVLVADGCRGAALLAADCGVVDYVVKPFEPAELKARVQAALRTKLTLDRLHALAWTVPPQRRSQATSR